MAMHNCNSLLVSSFYDTYSNLQEGIRLHSSFHGSQYVSLSVGHLATLRAARLCKDVIQKHMDRGLLVLWGPRPRTIVLAKTSRNRLYSVRCKDD
jgi:hypothetical protein